MEEINFDFVIKKALDIKEESIKAGVLCELAKGVINSDEDKKIILERMNKILDIADSFNDRRYKSIVIGQIVLVCANCIGVPCDSDLYIGMIDDVEAEKKFIERMNKIKGEVGYDSDIDISELNKWGLKT